MSFWRGFVDDFFTTNAIMKFTLLDNTTLLTNEFGTYEEIDFFAVY